MPLATEMSRKKVANECSCCGFLPEQRPKTLKFRSTMRKNRNMGVTPSGRERERTKVEGSVHGTIPWMSE
jgi:hypothetical protein